MSEKSKKKERTLGQKLLIVLIVLFVIVLIAFGSCLVILSGLSDI